MRGIEPIIAVVILVAVTLVIAIGVIGWIMGWRGTIGATEQLQIYGDSKLYAEGSVELHIANKGSASAVIYKVEVGGKQAELTTCSGATGLTYDDKNKFCTVAPGGDGTIQATFNDNLVPGASYVIKVYTKAGNTYQITLVAESKSS